MKSPTIGIKLADGSFYPVMEESVLGKKRLVLTSAQEKQKNVNIDIFRGLGSDLEGALKIGTLAVESSSGNQSDIDLVLEIDSEGRMTASAGVSDNPHRQTLSVSLNDYKLDETADFGDSSIPDLDQDFGNEFTGRLDQDILNDDSLAVDGLDVLDDLTLDGLGGDEPPFDTLEEELAMPKSDREILDDDTLVPAEGLEDFGGLTDESLDEFSLDDLDAEPLSQDVSAESAELTEPAAHSDVDFADFESLTLEDSPSSLDGLPDMDFDSIGSEDDLPMPKEAAPKVSPAPAKKPSDDFSMEDFSMDDGDEPLSLSDDLAELSMDDLSMDDLGNSQGASSPSDDFAKGMDFDFPSMDDRGTDQQEDLSSLNPPMDEEIVEEPKKSKGKQSAPAHPKERSSGRTDNNDKFALVMSLITLSLLVIAILSLLLINMIKVSFPKATAADTVYNLTLLQGETLSPQSIDGHLTLNLSEKGYADQTYPADEALELPSNLASLTLVYTPQQGDRADDLDRIFTRSSGRLSGEVIVPGKTLVVPSF